MKLQTWTLEDKQTALETSLELIKIPPHVSQSTRCALLRACFTAIFPMMLDQKSQNGKVNLKVLDMLLILVQELQVQHLEQSTLDEIFTLLEPHIKLADANGRDMAVRVLQTTLRTFLDNYPFDSDGQRAFSPGPYVAGCLVPRCFDSSHHVQSKALDSLHILVRIMNTFRNEYQDIESQPLCELRRLSASCYSPMATSQSGSDDETGSVSCPVIANVASTILIQDVDPEQLLPLVHSLVEGLLDVVSVSANGSSLILCSLLETRGHEEEAKAQATVLVGKLYSKLLHIENEDTFKKVLQAVRIVTSHCPKPVVTSLLADHRLPLDDQVTAIWKTIAQDPALAMTVTLYLIDLLYDFSQQTIEENGIGIKKEDVPVKARHTGLAAILALGTMFEMKEMEAIMGTNIDFSDVFVPILMAMSRYAGVSDYEELPITVKQSVYVASQRKEQVKKLAPYTVASDAMASFLTCTGCSSVAAVLQASINNLQYAATKTSDFSEVVSRLMDIIILDFPQYVTRIADKLTKSLADNHREVGSHRVVAAACFAQLLITETRVDHSNIELAVKNLLNLHDDKIPLVRTTAINGLAASFKADQTAHASRILSGILSLIGDDFESEVNFHALKGLKKIIPVLSPKLIKTRVSDIVSKVFPFFDGGRKRRDGAAAIRCFVELAKFTIEDCKGTHDKPYMEEFLELMNRVFLSLVLHSNDNAIDYRTETRDASREALENVLEIFTSVSDEPDPHLDKAKEMLRMTREDKKQLNYLEMLKEISKAEGCEKLSDFFVVHVNTLISYFRIGDARIRANAVYFLTFLLMENDSLCVEPEMVNPERICSEFSKLLSNDPSDEVKSVAAANFGKILIVLQNGRTKDE